jgi:hypothetical protein
MCRKFWFLDISDCMDEVKKPFNGMLKIPLVDGAFYRDFDLLEDEIPVELCNFIRHESDGAKLYNEYLATFNYDDIDLFECADYMPVGVDRSMFPLGSELVRR